ncbi:hypothetical protein [Streptomyces wuyuanensis]|uniref:hypothetical protein n=1 Tax=Streptomyces wuyuanensis TaxID=1196353 RepID=UPI003720B1F4
MFYDAGELACVANPAGGAFAWLMRSRRLARDYETRTDRSETVIRWSTSMS